jgi:hypothetical protein
MGAYALCLTRASNCRGGRGAVVDVAGWMDPLLEWSAIRVSLLQCTTDYPPSRPDLEPSVAAMWWPCVALLDHLQ